MEKTILRVEHLSHCYSADWAVKNVDFEVLEHDICGLLGSNGAGKSTAMNIICGVLKQTEGSVIIAGLDTRKERTAAKMNVGFLPQTPPLYGELTVEEYLVHAAEMRRVPDKQIPKAVDDVLAKCAITHFRNRLLSNLSGGYKQRVGIAQAIIHKPKLVVFDEPTNGLDPTQIIEVRGLIKSIAQESTVLISTHILQEVQAICNKIVMMDRGKLIFKGSIEDFGNYIVPDTIYLKIENSVTAEDIQRIEGVNSVEFIGEREFRIHFADQMETMEAIVEVSVKNNWHISEMRLERSSLDTIFSTLTKKHK